MQTLLLPTAMAIIFLSACGNKPSTPAATEDISTTRRLEGEELAERGHYLVSTNTCNECHSPKNMTPTGPVVDSTRLLSGHPANSKLPPFNASATQPGNWMNMASDITAFVGPWGVSYPANLTPDSATGIGAWTEDQFINTLKKGKHLGADNGRDLLPPMPWQYFGKMTDDDLRAIYAYLKSIPPVSNKVPPPMPPNEMGK